MRGLIFWSFFLVLAGWFVFRKNLVQILSNPLCQQHIYKELVPIAQDPSRTLLERKKSLDAIRDIGLGTSSCYGKRKSSYEAQVALWVVANEVAKRELTRAYEQYWGNHSETVPKDAARDEIVGYALQKYIDVIMMYPEDLEEKYTRPQVMRDSFNLIYSLRDRLSPAVMRNILNRTENISSIAQRSAPDNRLQSIEAKGNRISVETTVATSYKTFLMNNPPRLVVELFNTQYDFDQKLVQDSGPWIQQIRASQFQTEPLITRVVLDLKEPVRYRSSSQDNKIVVSLSSAPSSAFPTAAAQSIPPPPSDP